MLNDYFVMHIIVHNGSYATLSSRYFLAYLWSRLQRRFARDDDGVVHDLFDGREYKKFVQSGFLSSKANVSLTLNTDGVDISRSSKSSLWPIWLQINELPPTQR